MTISVTDSSVVYNGDGSTQQFDIAFNGNGIYIGPTSDVVVYLIDSNDIYTVQEEGTDYEVSASNTDSAYVTFYTAPATSERVRLERQTALTQALSLSNSGPFNPSDVGDALDKLTRAAQDLNNSYLDRYRGTWATATAYRAGEIAAHNTGAYTCIQTHTSASTDEPGTGANWELYWVLTATAGVDGIKGGLPYNFSTTVSMADPGSGNVRFNNAAVGSVTAIAIDDETSDAVDVAAFVNTWGDSTSTIKGHLIIASNTQGDTTFAIFNITAATDNVGWTQLTVTYVAGTLPSDGESINLAFSRTGNKGDAGAGSGDMLAATYDPAAIAQQVVGTTAVQTVSNKTFTAPTINNPALSADSVDAITEIAAALKSGADGTLITGTAGTSGDLAVWNADGDLVDGPTPPAGAIVGTTDTQSLTNKTVGSNTGVALGSDAHGDVYFRNTSGKLTRLAPGTAGEFLKTNGVNSDPEWGVAGGGFTLETATAVSGQASVTFSGIPSGTSIIYILLDDVSTNANGRDIDVRIGDSGGLESTGYEGRGTATDVWHVFESSTDAADTYSGIVTLIHNGSNEWIMSSVVQETGAAVSQSNGGRKTLTGELDRVAILHDSLGTFDGSGSVNILYA